MAAREYKNKYYHDNKTLTGRAGPKPIKHGTLYGYQGRKCRCEECKAAASEYARVRAGGSAPTLATPKYGTKASTNNRSKLA